MTVIARDTTTVRLHRLTMIDERDGVMVGRLDIGSYALFPSEGAETLRMLDAGTPLAEVAAWYEQVRGTPLDFDDFFEVLTDLEFLLPDGEELPAPALIRWRRLANRAFSLLAWFSYAALIIAAVIAMVLQPALRPSYRSFLFTHHLVVIPFALTAAMIPCILMHEAFHALAGRRLGLPSTLSISHRLYYVVAETRLDSLLSVPRRKRYLPFLAGMLADALQISALTLVAGYLRHLGLPGWAPTLCLAVALSCVLRLLWQFMFYLETDLYYVLTHALGCSDLQNATRFHLRTQFRRLRRRPAPEQDHIEWSDRDQAMARWYAPLLVLGYGFSLGSLLWAGLPTMVRFWTVIIGRFTAPHPSIAGILDAIAFVILSFAQWGVLAYVTLRDKRAKARATESEGTA